MLKKSYRVIGGPHNNAVLIPPPHLPPWPYLPLPILLYCNLYPLLQVVSEAQAIPYSIALSVSTQPALPPTHQPLNTPLTYGVIRLATGELPVATLPGLNGVITKVDPSMWIELEPAPNTGAGPKHWSRPQTLEPAPNTGAGPKHWSRPQTLELAPNTGANHNSPLS